MDKLNIYTSTGVKFWRHESQMQSFLDGTGHTVISTHISPEGDCNLNCPYCSVKKRDRRYVVDMSVIKKYVEDLMGRGLKAVIITGGGEPTLYPQINELVQWVHDKGLSIGLITNGTTSRFERWDLLSWVRISINMFPGWQTKIRKPECNADCVVGCSFIDCGNLEENISSISELLDRLGAQYVRILPNCLLNQADLLVEHERIAELFKTKIKDDRFFHQFKIHECPPYDQCSQSYFRPYLSEVDNGTVFPCDSLVLNDCNEEFCRDYALCKPDKILDYLDHKIVPNFKPHTHCQGCVFCNNLHLLEEFKRTRKFRKVPAIKHEEFV